MEAPKPNQNLVYIYHIQVVYLMIKPLKKYLKKYIFYFYSYSHKELTIVIL